MLKISQKGFFNAIIACSTDTSKIISKQFFPHRNSNSRSDASSSFLSGSAMPAIANAVGDIFQPDIPSEYHCNYKNI